MAGAALGDSADWDAAVFSQVRVSVDCLAAGTAHLVVHVTGVALVNLCGAPRLAGKVESP